MLHLGYTLYHQWTHREEFKILMIGADGAGKSTMLEKTKSVFANGKPVRTLAPSAITPTVGLNIARLEVLGRHLLLWDLGGHASLRSLWNNYYAQCHAIVFVVDSTNPQRIREAASLLRTIFTLPALEGVPVLIVSGKSDAQDSLGAHELLAKLDLVDLVLRPPPRRRGGPGGERGGGGGAVAVPIPSLDDADVTESTPWFGWELTEALRGTSGICGRAYRCVAASGATGDGITEGFEWLAEFLSLNARIVETL